MGKLKLYVWESVLSDYYDGIMFAYAESVEEARELIAKDMEFIHSDLLREPREVTEKEGFHIYGGM